MIGQLGNHLFQYAFIYSASKKLNTDFLTIYGKTRTTIPRIEKYFSLSKRKKKANSLTTLLLRFVQTLKKNKKITGKEIPENILKNLENHTIYEGYMQSEEYFSDYKREVTSLFKIKQAYIDEFHTKYNQILKNKKIVVHIRRGDYKEAGDDFLGGLDLRLPLQYYYQALKEISNINDYIIIFISDDISYCKNNFGHLENATFEANDEIIDFQLLMNADIAIIANSTFSWWASYLNNNINKQIFAPKYWLGFKIKEEYPARIMSGLDWTWIDPTPQSDD